MRKLWLFILPTITLAIWLWPRGSGPDTVRFLDIGQGDAALVTGVDQTQLLIDAGPNNAILNQLGSAIPLTDRTIEAAVISHPHADHYRGFRAVLERYRIITLYVSAANPDDQEYQGLLELARGKGTEVKVGAADETGTRGGITYRFISSGKGDPPPRNLNNASVVLLVTLRNQTLLFPGDAEKEEEAELVKVGLGPVAVLKVPHHGSRTSSTEDFVSTVNPRLAVISVGQDNRYGHPADETVARLESHGAHVLRTDRSGSVTIHLAGTALKFSTER